MILNLPTDDCRRAEQVAGARQADALLPSRNATCVFKAKDASGVALRKTSDFSIFAEHVGNPCALGALVDGHGKVMMLCFYRTADIHFA
jgi:hypothetical protein